MPRPHDLVDATYRYFADSLSFEELYDMALDVHMELTFSDPDGFVNRLAGMIVLAAAEEPTGLHGRDETRRLILDVLRDEAVRGLRSTA